MVSFFRNLDTYIEIAKNSKNLAFLELLNDVKSYVKSGAFTTYKKVDVILAYWGEPDTTVSKATGMKETTVRVTRRNLSNDLYEKFGLDFFNLVQDGSKKSYHECLGRYNYVTLHKNAVDYIPSSFITRISDEAVIGDFPVNDCINEILFLTKFSFPSFNEEMKKVNPDKLLYLIRLLNREVGTPKDTYAFMNLIERKSKE